MSALPLTPGQRGEAVRDLQRRLASAGFTDDSTTPGVFCSDTANLVEAFQLARGLRVSGICDDDTWTALIEAGHRLGSRLLMLVAPNLRGDDVVELQSSLAKLGFDPGRIDGILGADTIRALRDFQSNSGLTVDGVCGPQTITALEVLARQSGDGPGIAAIKELESIRAGARTFSELRIVVGQFGGMSSVARQLVQALRQRSATVVVSDEPDASAQAAIANRFQATVYLGFTATPQANDRVEFFSAPTFESAGGRSLAELIVTNFNRLPTVADDTSFSTAGMRVPILRATKMPAVLVSVGSVQTLHDHSDGFVGAIVEALADWVKDPWFSTDLSADAR